MPDFAPQGIFVAFFAILQAIVKWWWLWLPFVLYKPFVTMWIWWRREIWLSKQRFVILDVRVPADVEKSYMAMENVFTGIWQALHDPPDIPEKWLDGKFQLPIAVEIVSIAGEIHFYFAMLQGVRKGVESAIYSQFPSAEFSEAEDYSRKIPFDIPNREWNLWGTNYRFQKSDVYPIKTFMKFFEPRPDAKEETKVDPMGLLLEGLSRLGEGEQLWIQYLLSPITPEDDYDYVALGRKEIDRIVEERAKPKAAAGPRLPWFLTLFRDTIIQIVTGQPPAEEEQKKEERVPAAFEFTPGVREMTSAIEQKIGKYAFRSSVRFIYLAKIDNYFSPAKGFAMSYFTQFSTQTLNKLRPFKATLTKVNTITMRFLDKRRTYLVKRRLLRKYLRREPPEGSAGHVLLNTEEMATLFHFPGRLTATTAPLARVETKRGGAPPELPTE
ncbi:MAG: hypothetical protein HYW95_03375 [Candidatus Wildermuthbacteria bacterium]|nr:hypothetical protein [Candidatus Wildermuthbacteria bacterium]